MKKNLKNQAIKSVGFVPMHKGKILSPKISTNKGLAAINRKRILDNEKKAQEQKEREAEELRKARVFNNCLNVLVDLQYR